MSFARFFRIAIFAPVLLGLLGLVAPGLPFVGAFAITLLGAWVPYIIFLVALKIWSVGRSDRTLKTTSLILPVIFLPLSIGFYWWAYGTENLPAVFVEIGAISLVVGYIYVGMFWAIWLVGQRLAGKQGAT